MTEDKLNWTVTLSARTAPRRKIACRKQKTDETIQYISGMPGFRDVEIKLGKSGKLLESSDGFTILRSFPKSQKIFGLENILQTKV